MKKAVITSVIVGFILISGCMKQSSKEHINPFFFNHAVSSATYNAKILTDETLEQETSMHVEKIADLNNGGLYEFKLDSLDGLSDDRLSLGYFYVQPDKIIKIDPTNLKLDSLKKNDTLPEDSVIVCQENELKDNLLKDEAGWHHYIIVDGDKREYHSYNDQVTSGYYETFIWHKDKGLIYYTSGYGAGRDSIELTIK